MRIYRKDPVHRHHCIQSHSDTWSQARDLTHRKQTVCRPSVSYMEKTDLVQLRWADACLLLKIRPVTGNRHSTGTHPANMPRNSAASCCNIR